MNRHEKLVASRWIPKGYRKVAHPDGEELGVVYISEPEQLVGRIAVLAYRGHAKHNAFHYSYKTEEEVNKKVGQFFEGIVSHKEYVSSRRKERKAAEEVPIKTGEYVSVARTAKLIRVALAKKFPGVKFSVRSSSYSGGASIDVYWKEGPDKKTVDAVVDPFEGSGFDGSIDLKYSCQSWLLPDGTAAYGRSSGTEGSMGYVSAYNHEKPHPDAILCHFGANYVFLHREEEEHAAVA